VRRSAEVVRKKRSAANPAHLYWSARGSHPAAAAAAADRWSNVLRRLSSRLALQSSPHLKRTADWQRRTISSQDDDTAGGDSEWNENGWADNNLRIWG